MLKNNGFHNRHSPILRAFSPLSLFSGGAPGAWYDPSDYTTLFQDSAGTTPVTAVEQPVGLMLDKSQGLVLGPELLTNGDFSNGTTGWTPSGCIQQVVGNELELTAIVPGFISSDATITTVVGRTYKYTANIRRNQSSGTARITVVAVIDGSQVISLTPSSVSIIFKAVGTTTTIRLGAFNAILADKFSYSVASVKELAGNHAFQATSASRPVLSARYNLLTKTEQFDDAAWTKTGVSVTSNTTVAPNGTLTADTLSCSGNSNHQFLASIGTTGNSTILMYVKKTVSPCFYIGSFSHGGTVYFDLINKTVSSLVSPAINASIVDDGNGFVLCKVTFAAISNFLHFGFLDAVYTGTSAFPWAIATQATEGVIWGASLVPANQSTLPYQRVNTATDYATTGFLPYLRFDGVDDSLSTNSISFTSTDKMSVFAGVRKLSDAAIGVPVELSANTSANTGAFVFAAPATTANANYFWGSRGSAALVGATTTNSFASPITNVFTGLGDISGDLSALRLNGAQVAQSTADQGSGNYGNYPLYIGRRNNASLPFNGQLYSMVIVGKAVTAGELSSTETYVNQKTGAY